MGYQCDLSNLRQARQNLSSVRQHPEAVRWYLDKEREAGRMITVGRVEQAEALGVLQPLRGNPKEGQGRQMAAHSRLVVSGRWQHE